MDEDTKLTVQNAVDKLNTIEGKIIIEQHRRAVHYTRYDSIRKLLAIMHDKQVFAAAIPGKSRIRLAVNHFGHREVPYNDMVKDALSRVGDIVEEFENSTENVEALGPEGGDVEEDTQLIQDLLMNSDKFFDERGSDIESEIDTQMHETTRHKHFDKSYNSDYHVFVEWLEKFKPTSGGTV